MRCPLLPGKSKLAASSDDPHVFLEQGRQPMAAVFPGVVLAADPHAPDVEQADREGDHTIAVQLVTREITGDPAPDGGEGVGEVEHRVELLAVAPQPPERVIEVLLARRRVDPRRLEMSEPIKADPDVLPGGRDRKAADSLERVLIGDPVAVLIDVGEAAPASHAAQARARAVGAPQSWHGDRFRDQPGRTSASLPSAAAGSAAADSARASLVSAASAAISP